MMALPRLATVGISSLTYQSSVIRSKAGLPATVALVKSGNIVPPWLPQTASFEIWATVELVF